MNTFKKFLAIALLSTAAAAQATVLDFNGASEQFWINSYSESGFNFNLAVAEGMGTITEPPSYWNGNGTGHLLTWTNQSNASGFQLSNGSGTHFSIQSFDFGNGYTAGNLNPTSFDITGTTGSGGTVSASVDHSALGIYTYSFGAGWTDLVSVVFQANGNSNRAFFDNVVVDAPSNNNVPEPMTLAIFGLGLAGLVLSRRKQA